MAVIGSTTPRDTSPAAVAGHAAATGIEDQGQLTVRDTANKKNLLLLLTLRWIAVGGQILTIGFVHAWLGFALPLVPMGFVVLFLVGLNVFSLFRSSTRPVITDMELFLELLMDVAALTVQLYLSGGAINPFVSLFLLQVILGAALFRPPLTWILVAVTSGCFVLLTRYYREIDLSSYEQGHLHGQPSFLELHILGMFLCFLLAAVLLVLFVGRINENLRNRDQRLAELRQQSAEEQHILRMGLLATGAAHDLGTPLATLSVILNDWERNPVLRGHPEFRAELDEMHAALARCKDSVSSILLAAGETRGEEAERTTLAGFLDDVVAVWRETRQPTHVEYVARIGTDTAIASDTVIRQILFNVFDNALEASPGWVGIEASRRKQLLVVRVRDKGPGFTPDILANLGKAYQSTKNRPENGLGLFLVVNVLRKLGGTIVAQNNRDGGALVELCVPIDALSIEDEERHAIG